jgi:transcriptional regulator GlxA family with amidase domain
MVIGASCQGSGHLPEQGTLTGQFCCVYWLQAPDACSQGPTHSRSCGDVIIGGRGDFKVSGGR